MEIKPGYGYRLVKITDTIRHGDEFWNIGRARWESTVISGRFTSDLINRNIGAYRRKIDVAEGYELVPPKEIESGDMQFTFDGGLTWHKNPRTNLGNSVSYYSDNDSGVNAFRRPIQYEWLDINTVKPDLGQKIWINHKKHGVLFTKFTGSTVNWSQWRIVKESEIPKAPPVPVKTQYEIDRESSFGWLRSRTSIQFTIPFALKGLLGIDGANQLIDEGLRSAYEAGRREERASSK